jgi:hypothetical protein
MKGSVTIPIGGELESRATDGRVVSADGVYDYLIGASQEEINASVIGGQIQLEDCWDTAEYADAPVLDDSSDSGSDS